MLICKCGKCKKIINEYRDDNKIYNDNIRDKKSGVVIHNTDTNHILLVQSRGNLWGFPKGSLEINESFIDCAIRELREETGINIDSKQLSREYELNKFAKYYYISTSNIYNNLEIIEDDSNDASGLFWIKLDCLEDLLYNDAINLNYHAKKCLYNYFKISIHKF